MNRVFRDKPNGLVVDYPGLADQLKQALVTYTESGGQGDPTFDTATKRSEEMGLTGDGKANAPSMHAPSQVAHHAVERREL